MRGTSGHSERALTHVMPVVAGVFVLRYVATGEAKPPRVLVAADPDSEGSLDFLFSPGAVGGVLRKPGDLCVISSAMPGRILVTTLGEDLSRAEAVTLKLDRLDEDPASKPPGKEPSTIGNGTLPVEGTAVALRIVGHVELEGDRTVAAGEWLGGGGRQIEGFALQWPRRPANVDISYSASVRGVGRMPDVLVGEFAGTRQKARSLNGASFRLIGDDAKSFSLLVEAEFDDGTRIGPLPAPIDLRGPTGRERLVGLSLVLIKLKAAAAEPPAVRPPAKRGDRPAVPTAPAAASRQVRVFRANKTDIRSNKR